jgi:hypothetical protein
VFAGIGVVNSTENSGDLVVVEINVVFIGVVFVAIC